MAKGRPAVSAGRPFALCLSSRPRSLGGREDVHDATAALGAELDVAADEGEQRVVATTADAAAGVEVGAALPDDDLAGVDELAAVALHAEALGVRVPTVLGRGCALLVCHEFSPSVRRSVTGRSGVDAGDLDLGVLLAVTLALAVAGLVLVLEDRDLRALGGPHDLSGHARLGQRVGASGDLLAVDEHEDGQGDRVTHLVGNLVDLDDVADSNLLLLAATAHDRVHHGLTLFFGLQRWVARSGQAHRSHREGRAGSGAIHARRRSDAP